MPAKKKTMPAQKQTTKPGREHEMTPRPKAEDAQHRGSGKLAGKVALITGGDSGIGRAVAIAFAKETQRLVEEHGRQCVLLRGDIGDEKLCRRIVDQTVKQLGHLDVLVNNASEQHPQESIEDITAEQLERTFRTNVFGYFFMTKAAMKHLREGSCIINTTSVTAYKGSAELLDYSATKGAEVAFTRSLSQNLAEKKIRVNAVAPGPIWTPLIPSTFDEEKVETFGGDVPLGRPGQPEEVAPSYVFLASDDSSYITGQVLHPNGGSGVNGQ